MPPKAPTPPAPNTQANFATQADIDVSRGETESTPPVPTAVSDKRDPLTELLGPDVIKKLIEAGVKQQLDAMGIQANTQRVTGSSTAIPDAPQFKFLKHYRNDTSPEILVQELNMDAEVPQLEPIPGQYMRFRRGHFFATTENQVKQLDWMMGMAEHSADTSQSLGGNRGIYEDDNEKIYYCTAGCSRADFHSASEAKFKAHMRGTHGVIL